MATRVPCPCGEPIHRGDSACRACGAPVDPETEARLDAALVAVAHAAAADDKIYVQQVKVRKAANMIAVLAVVFLVSGVIFFFIHKNQADEALERLAGFAGDAVLPAIEGVTYTAAELRAKVAAEPVQLLVVNLVLAAIMVVLHLWAKRAALPAILTALALFVGVHLVNFALDPATLVQGIVIKVLAIAAFLTGIKAALEARAAAQRTAGD